MAFWRRINQPNFQFILNQYRRFYLQAPYASSVHQTRISVFEKPVCGIDKKPSYFCSNVRFFAAPAQAVKNKKEEPSKDGPRLNEQITARVVRLVMEDGGHSIVPIQKALELARQRDLDLVEVDRKDNPIVCRLMDFHQKKYQQRVKEKERAKAKVKAGEKLKNGECKEVRFTEKIEGKDLKIKAESVIRLMERGYRVKCMAVGKGKEGEDEDLGGLLSRLTDLIEGVASVVSGPWVERKQAYVIVRHVKFGPSKKGGGKTAMVDGTMAEPPTKSAIDGPMLPQDDSLKSGSEPEDDLPTPSPVQMWAENVDDKKIAWSTSESGDDFGKLFNLNDGVSSNSTRKEIHATQQRVSSPQNDHASMFLHPKPDVNTPASNTSQYPRPETSLGIDNRYKRTESRNQFPPARSMEHLGPRTRESVRMEPQFPFSRGQPPQNMGQVTGESVRSESQFPYPQRQPHPNTGQRTRDIPCNSPASNTSQYPRPETSLGIDNRYKRTESRNQFPPARSMEHLGPRTRESVRMEPQFPFSRGQPPQNMGQVTGESVRSESQFPCPQRQPHPNMGQSTGESVRSESQFPYPQRQPPQNMSTISSVPETKQVENNASPFTNPKPPSSDLPKQQLSHSDVPGTPAPSFGIFSTKANSSGKQEIAADAHGSSEGNRYASLGSNEGNRSASLRNRGMGRNAANQNLPGSKFDVSQRPDPDGNMGGQGRFGIFSRDNSNTTSNTMPKSS